jgi:hypothetical protein
MYLLLGDPRASISRPRPILTLLTNPFTLKHQTQGHLETPNSRSGHLKNCCKEWGSVPNLASTRLSQRPCPRGPAPKTHPNSSNNPFTLNHPHIQTLVIGRDAQGLVISDHRKSTSTLFHPLALPFPTPKPCEHAIVSTPLPSRPGTLTGCPRLLSAPSPSWPAMPSPNDSTALATRGHGDDDGDGGDDDDNDDGEDETDSHGLMMTGAGHFQEVSNVCNTESILSPAAGDQHGELLPTGHVRHPRGVQDPLEPGQEEGFQQ